MDTTQRRFAIYRMAWLAALIALFSWLCIHGAADYHYSADELIHVDISKGRTLGEVLRFSLFEPHPPVGYLLRHYWLSINDAPAFVRGQSLLFGALAIILYYRIGRMLNGSLTGVSIAALVAFSPEYIRQSYLVRNYAFFDFFIALYFYRYLRWRHGHRMGRLGLYGVSGILACLTNFAGIFTVATVGIYESLFPAQKVAPRARGAWILIHALMAVIVVAVWQLVFPQGIAALQAETRGIMPIEMLRQHVGLYPQKVLGFLLPYAMEVHHAWLVPLALAALLLFAAWRDKPLRPLLLLSAIAFALGMGLFASGIYPYMDGRHVLWLLPFVVLPLGWLLADVCAWLADKLPVPRTISVGAFMIGFLITGWTNSHQRFSYGLEYQITDDQWQAFTSYLGGLDADSLILARRHDAILMDPPGINPFSFIAQDDLPMAVIPYHHTRILFLPRRSHPWFYRDNDLSLRMVEDAEHRGLLKGVKTLVFVGTEWSGSFLVPLLNCPALPKTIVTFPPSPPGHVLAETELFYTQAVVLSVQKQIFMEKALSATGPAKACFQ